MKWIVWFYLPKLFVLTIMTSRVVIWQVVILSLYSHHSPGFPFRFLQGVGGMTQRGGQSYWTCKPSSQKILDKHTPHRKYLSGVESMNIYRWLIQKKKKILRFSASFLIIYCVKINVSQHLLSIWCTLKYSVNPPWMGNLALSSCVFTTFSSFSVFQITC